MRGCHPVYRLLRPGQENWQDSRANPYWQEEDRPNAGSVLQEPGQGIQPNHLQEAGHQGSSRLQGLQELVFSFLL